MSDVNDWAEPNVIYTVSVRNPRTGDRYLAGGKVYVAERDMNHVKHPVIVAEEVAG